MATLVSRCPVWDVKVRCGLMEKTGESFFRDIVDVNGMAPPESLTPIRGMALSPKL